jgi:hypothetical protein
MIGLALRLNRKLNGAARQIGICRALAAKVMAHHLTSRSTGRGVSVPLIENLDGCGVVSRAGYLRRYAAALKQRQWCRCKSKIKNQRQAARFGSGRHI